MLTPRHFDHSNGPCGSPTTSRTPGPTVASLDPLLRLRQHFEFLRDENTTRDFTRGCLIGGFGTEMADHSDMIREAVRVGLESWAQALAAPSAQAQESGQVTATTTAKTLA
jgi:TetR/AcrR family transcriptional regulator, transcriptional repressor for nem operon